MNDLREKAKSLYEADKIVGKSEEIQAVRDIIAKVSRSGSSTVLIEGESGTGKELVAKAVHSTVRVKRAFCRSQLLGHPLFSPGE